MDVVFKVVTEERCTALLLLLCSEDCERHEFTRGYPDIEV